MGSTIAVWTTGTLFLLCLGAASGQPSREARPADTTEEGGPSGKSNARERVVYNLDCSEFFVGTFGPPVPETIDAFVDHHASIGVTDLFINVNAQRTNYRSDVWESDWDGYDPTAGDDQPFFAGIAPDRRFETQLTKNVLALYEQGCDYGARMIARARYRGVKPWISIRMNDAHAPDLPDHPYHSTFWRAHPEWRLSDSPSDWCGMDYEQPEVREHYMKLVKEVCARYDLDGLELDYLRFERHFRPGRQHEGAKLMTAFVRQVRAVTRAAAQRLGHPVPLAVRVPMTPWIARMHGLDAVAWARAGLVDLVVASPFWPSSDSDVPIETWKGLLEGTGVEVSFSLEDGINSGGSGRRTMTPEEMRGVLVSGLQRGADGVYFFNLFTGPYHDWPREAHDQLVKDAGSYAALRSGPRRHPLTIRSPWAAGEPSNPCPLPFTGTQGTFRIHIGPRPMARQSAHIEIAVVERPQPLDVRANGVPCSWSHLADSGRHVYDIPRDALSDGYNLIEVGADQDATITWVEIAVQ